MTKPPQDTRKDDDDIAFEMWKHYGEIGGRDKDTMIKIVTWLLGFSSLVLTAFGAAKFLEKFPPFLLPIIGIVISFIAAYISLLYGAYAAWNWAIADRIAEEHSWKELSPTYNPFKVKDERLRDIRKRSEKKDKAATEKDGPATTTEKDEPAITTEKDEPLSDNRKLILLLARPCEDRIPDVFWFFFFVSLVSLIAHAVLLYGLTISRTCV